MEYKIGRLLGNKPKEGALSAISDKLIDGDVVLLTSNIIDSAVIESDITIDGQGHTFYIEDANGAGLILENHCKVQNCNFVVGKKTNAIYLRRGDLTLWLENCTFVHSAWKDEYPSIVSRKNESADQIICDNVTLDYGNLNTRSLIADNFFLGNPNSEYYSKIWCNDAATEVEIGTLAAVKANLHVKGKIQQLACLEIGLNAKEGHILIDEQTFDLGLDAQEIISQKVITGLGIVGNTTINQVVTPECTPEMLKRYQEYGKSFNINPSNKDTLVKINGGSWNVTNKWGNQVYQGAIEFKNYTDETSWYFESEDVKKTWTNCNFGYTDDFVPKPKPVEKKPAVEQKPEAKPKPKKKTAQEKLNEMIGLNEVKQKVQTYIATNLANKKRKELGMDVADNSLHLIFGGAAGTGKTQVARLLTEILYDNGIIEKNELKEVSVKDMVAEYVGQTSPKTHELIQEALGGVLFIDEAYELIPEEGKDSFKREAITTLVKDMDDYRANLIVIMAGYTDEMEQLLKANAGLPSRFVNKIHFPDYSEDELVEIANLQLRQQSQVLDTAAKEKLESFIRQAKQNGQVDGNGRWVRNLLQFISQARDVRIVTDNLLDDLEALNKITVADVTSGIANLM